MLNGWGVKFDENGQNANERVQHYMLQWQNGKMNTVWPEEFTTPPRQVDPPRPVGPEEVAGPAAQVTALPQLLVSTMLLGGIYALIAVGLTLIFGIMRVVNFAHGEFLMLGMYLAFWSFTLWGVDPYFILVRRVPLFFASGSAVLRPGDARRSSTPPTTCRSSPPSACRSRCRTWPSCSGRATSAS